MTSRPYVALDVLLPCERCRVYFDGNEIICGFGLCDSCFEEQCPCNEGRPGACPLHPWPDVVLEGRACV